MTSKYKTRGIMIVVLLFLWISGCDAPLSDSTDAGKIGTKSVSLSPPSVGGLNEIVDLILTGESPGRQQFGNFLFQGDVNGDSYDDLLITASNYDSRRGRAYLYYGGPDMDANADKIFTGENTDDLFGEGAFLSDLNNDGFSDVIVVLQRNFVSSIAYKVVPIHRDLCQSR